MFDDRKALEDMVATLTRRMNDAAGRVSAIRAMLAEGRTDDAVQELVDLEELLR